MKKPALSPSLFILLYGALNLILFNLPLYSYSLNNFDDFSISSLTALLTLTALNLLLTTVLLTLMSLLHGSLMKLIGALLFVTNSAAVYFISTYQVFLTKDMIGNILNTKTEESSELFSIKLVLYVLILGVLPCWLIFRTRLKEQKRLRQLRDSSLIVVVCAGLIYASSASWLWVDKHAKYLGALILPWSYIANTVRFQQEAAKANAVPEMLPDAVFSNDQKTLVVLVIGETARSANFSLYGYERETNPLLAKENVIALADPTSCSTYTTASVRCILSNDNSSSTFYEPLPTYLKRHGVDVIWRTNNWGEPNIDVTEYQAGSALRPNCTRDDCALDGVLLTGLTERIKASTSNRILVVLHQKGSHGPNYYTRYTNNFHEYEPVCTSVELDKCSNEEIVNAYDNSILYTDYFLTSIISELKALTELPSVMLYLSDHGESLGEFGLYLHGAPYSLAPDVQKKIPFIIWPSQAFTDQHQLNLNAIRSQSSHSQDDVFHSVMGAFGMQSEIYKPELDIFNRGK